MLWWCVSISFNDGSAMNGRQAIIQTNDDPFIRRMKASDQDGLKDENFKLTRLLYHVSWLRLLNMMSGGVYQKQVSKAGTSNYIPQIQWDMITCPCPWYLLLAQHSWYHVQMLSVETFYPIIKCTCGCYALFWFVYIIRYLLCIGPYSSRLIHWYWGNQGYFIGPGVIAWLSQGQWNNPETHGYQTTTKHNNARTLCITLGIYYQNIFDFYMYLQLL